MRGLKGDGSSTHPPTAIASAAAHAVLRANDKETRTAGRRPFFMNLLRLIFVAFGKIRTSCVAASRESGRHYRKATIERKNAAGVKDNCVASSRASVR